MRVKFDFSVDAWLQEVEVNGKSEEECLDNLYSMSLADLIEAGYVKDFEIKNVDSEITEVSYKVEVSDIKYDITEDDADELGMTEEQLEDTLPKKLVVDLRYIDPNDIEDELNDEIEYKTKFLTKNYTYKILETY